MATRLRRCSTTAVLVAAVALLGAVAAAPAMAAQSGCTLTPTGGTVTRSVGARTYTVNVPPGLTGTQVPLLLSLHGFGSTSAQDELFTGWTPFAAAKKFIVAYPQGRPFEFGGAWDPYTPVSTDVADLKTIAADISAQWCVDPQRMYVDGWSNGAVMSQRVACDAADTFAAVTSYGGGTPLAGGVATPCQPSRPISVGVFAGQFDFTYLTLAQNGAEWRATNSCGPTAVHSTDTHGSQDRYSCAAGTQVLVRTVGLTSHNWPIGARGEDQRSRMWAFFMANPRP